jgi:putative tricarboxylic transport membrane protein
LKSSPKDKRRLGSESARANLILAAAAAALGLFLLLRLSQIGMGAGYDRIGPRFFPYAAAIGLLLLAGWFSLSAWTLGRKGTPAQGTPEPSLPFNWSCVGYFGLALLLNLALLERAGFVIACTVQFWLVARAFRSKKPQRDALVAVILSAAVYYSFSHLLGLRLPAGILEGLF